MQVLVIFGGTNTFKIVDIRSILGSVLGQSFTRLILVLQSEMTAPAKKATKEVHFKVELFKVSILCLSPLLEVLLWVIFCCLQLKVIDEKQ